MSHKNVLTPHPQSNMCSHCQFVLFCSWLFFRVFTLDDILLFFFNVVACGICHLMSFYYLFTLFRVTFCYLRVRLISRQIASGCMLMSAWSNLRKGNHTVKDYVYNVHICTSEGRATRAIAFYFLFEWL